MAGGKREGAGRPPKGDSPKTKINITIDPDILAEIDRATGNRSQWLEDAAKAYLDQPEGEQ